MNSILILLVLCQEPYRVMLDRPVEYTGADSLEKRIDQVDTIRIGLFCPDADRSGVSRAMIEGASLAVEQAPLYKGKSFKLVRRWIEGRWGDAGKAALEMIYQDQVWALIGGPDSATTHLAEQIALKTRIPLLAPVSCDPSLTHTRVPWIFRLPPSFDQQAGFLTDYFKENKLSRIGLVTSTSLDGRQFSDALKNHMDQFVFHFSNPPSEELSHSNLVARMQTQQVDALVIYQDSIKADDPFFSTIFKFPVFIPWIPCHEKPTPVPPLFQELIFLPGPYFIEFEQSFTARFGYSPDLAAALSFDAAKMIIQAVLKRGLSRKAIRNSIALNEHPGPFNFSYQWDNGGGNTPSTEFKMVMKTSKP